VLPGSRVFLVTLNTGHSVDVVAAADGSFSATLFAPPGVSVLVKAGPPSALINNPLFLLCMPGTIIGSAEPPVNSSSLRVAGAGLTANFSRPAWTFDGTIATLKYAPGESLHLTGVMTIVSSDLQSAGTMTVSANLFLERLSGPDGTGSLGHNTFASIFMTPTGFPIEREPSLNFTGAKQFPLAKADSSHAMSSIDLSYTLPATLIAGYYRPYIVFSFTGVPNVPFDPPVLLVNNAARLWGQPLALLLPIIRVGASQPPRLFWTLLTDELSGGTRGVGAIEDRNRFAVASRIVTQSDTFIIPRSDPDTGNPIPYRIEPFALTVSVSNGANPMPSIPLIPFRFPSGRLTVTVQKPDGSVSSIGPAPFVQSRSRELSTSGQPMDPAGGHIQDAYQLSTMDPRFEITFAEDGRHVITMEGSIDDIWGNTWSASGTYEVYVARPLSLDTAVLPGTPFEAGDTFASGVVVSPPAPVSVQVRMRLLPNSDTGKAIETTVSGVANAFGYFRPAGNGIPMDQPGEYRVDVTASFTDRNGNLWMGSRTWGGVVAARTPGIVAHGRRGTDQGDLAGVQWFYRTQTGIPTGSDHLRLPFNSGDVLWAQQDDAADPMVTFQDPTGTFLNLLRTRLIEGHPEAFSIGQTPLYLSRPDSQEPHLDPSKVDLWAYGYTSIQRPLVRVREEVLGGVFEASPYWRFCFVPYSGEVGANPNGDVPNIFKFQYGGVVLRGSALTQPEYAIYGSLFVLVPVNDPLGGSRVFPPFQGNGGGPSGGPLMTLKGRNIDMFFHPTAVRPGSVLETGDMFVMAGAVAPDSFPDAQTKSATFTNLQMISPLPKRGSTRSM
jgi:hypothetical protein